MLVRGHRTLRINPQTPRVRDRELLRDERRHPRRDGGRILSQERTQHPHRPPLHREPEPILIPALAPKQAQRLAVQPEEALQLKRRRISREPPETRDLLPRQKLDRHRPTTLRRQTRHQHPTTPVLALNPVPFFPEPVQRPADRRTPPPRHQADTQSPPDLPPQRRPHLRAHQHHRNRATDPRANRNRTTQTTARERAAARAAARAPRRQTHRPQRALNLPRTRPYLHPHRHRARPPHPHPTPHPRTTPDHATLARTKARRTSTLVVRKMGLGRGP